MHVCCFNVQIIEANEAKWDIDEYIFFSFNIVSNLRFDHGIFSNFTKFCFCNHNHWINFHPFHSFHFDNIANKQHVSILKGVGIGDGQLRD